MQNNSNVEVKNGESNKKKKVKKVVMKEEIVEQNNDETLVFPDKNWDGLVNGETHITEIIQELVDDKVVPSAVVQSDSYQLEPIVVMKKKTYTDAHRRAQQRYREKYPEKYHSLQRKLYQEKIADEEKRKIVLEKARINNQKQRDKKKA